jgi:hypothetical protein
MTIDASYKKYFADRSFERKDLLQQLVEKYTIESALYPGSYTHVTLSFYIPHVVYVDSDPKAKKIFNDIESVQRFVDQHKTYAEDAIIEWYGQSYAKPIPTKKKVDFLFSQYAGPISQDCKQYLKKGGILVANNSHADAGLAFLDPDYELVAVAQNHADKVRISEKNLEEYFIPKKEKMTLAQLRAHGKGLGYTKTASNYIFYKFR